MKRTIPNTFLVPVLSGLPDSQQISQAHSLLSLCIITDPPTVNAVP